MEPMDVDPSGLYTEKDIARWIGLHVSQISRLVNHHDPKKRLPAYRIGGSVRVKGSDWLAYLERCAIAPTSLEGE